MAIRITDGALSWSATIDDSELNRVADRMEARFGRLGNRVRDESASIESFAKRAASAAAGYLTLQGAAGFVRQMVQVRSQFQQLEISFRTMLKSKEKADSLMKDLVVFAGTTPFGLKETASAAKQLLAYGSTAESVVSELRMLGDVASGVSVPVGDLVYLYGTLKTQGRAYAMDIRQFAGRGIPIYAELAKVLKVGKDEVAGLVEAGKVGFPQVEQAFKNMTASAGMFGGLMEAQSKTLSGQLERLSDAWDLMLNSMGQSNEGLFSASISGAISLVENYEKVVDILTVLVATYGVYRAALLATSAYQTALEASTFGMAVSLNQESVSRIANANAVANEMRTEVASLAVKKAAASQSAQNALATLREAQAKLSNAAAEGSIAAAETAAIARKRALAVSSEFFAAKQALETASKNGGSVATLANLRAEVSSLAIKKASATQAAIQAAANLKVAESKAVQAASENVIAAQERLSISRKAALAASSEFYTAKTNLETTAKIGSSAATVELTAVESLNAAGKRALAVATSAYNAVLAASPVLAFTAVLSALGIAIYSLTQVTDAAEESQRVFNQAIDEGGKSADTETRKVEQLITVLNDHNATLEQKKVAYEKLQEQTGGMLKAYSQEDIAVGKAAKTLEEYIKTIKEAATARAAFSEFNALAEKMDELDRKGIESIGTWTKLGRSLKNTFTPTSQGLTVNEWLGGLGSGDEASDKIVAQERDVLNKAMGKLKKEFGGKFSEIVTGVDDTTTAPAKLKNKAYFEKIVKDNTDRLEGLDKASKTFERDAAPLKKKISDAQNELLSFNLVKPAAAAKEENSALKRKEDLLKKIYELNEKYSLQALTDDKQKLAEIRSQYKALQDEIDAYNKDPKNKKVNPNLKPQLEKAIANQEYENDTKKLKIQLDKQEELYAEYDKFKADFGSTAANKEYADKIKEYSSYLKKLEAERAKLLLKDPTTMSGPEKERLEDYNARIAAEVKVQKEAYSALLLSNATYEQQKAAATDKYNAAYLLLTGEANAGRRKVLTQGYKDEVNGLKDSALQKTEVYKKLAEETYILTRQETIRQIDALNKVLESGTIPPDAAKTIQANIDKLKWNLNIGVDEGNIESLKNEFALVAQELNSKDENGDSIISDEEKKRIIKRLAEIQDKIAGIDSNGDGVASWGDKVAQQFQYMKGDTAEVAQGMSDDLSRLSSGFNELSGALGGNDTQAGYLLDTIGQLAGAASDAAGAFASFANGDIIGGITKTISAVGKIFSIGKKVREMNEAARKEVEDFYKNAVAGEREYQDLLKERQLLTIRNNKVAMQGIRDEIALRRSQSAEYAKESLEIMAKLQGKEFIQSESYKHGTWFRKAEVKKTMGSLNGMSFEQLSQLLAQGKLEGETKALVERLVELEQKGYDAAQALADLADQANQELTGTTAGGIADAIIDGFKQGKRSAADFADTFQDMMTDAMYNALSNDYLDQAVADYYKKFAELSKDGLTDDEIKELRADWTGILAEGAKRANDIDKVTGGSTSGSSNNSLAGSIKAELTEQTGSVIAGSINGMRLILFDIRELMRSIGKSSLDLLLVAQEHLDIAKKTERNTFKTATNSELLIDVKDSLNSINRKMDDNANAMAATGRKI